MLKKNILIIVPNLKFGGAQKVAILLSEHLSLNEKVSILTFSTATREYQYSGFRYCLNENNTTPKIIKLINRAKKIAKFCKEKKIDMIISHMEEANFAVVLSKYFKNESKIVLTVHANPLRYGKIYNFLIKKLYVKANKVISVSRGIERTLKTKFQIENVSTIYNPIDLDNLPTILKQSLPNKIKHVIEDSFVFISIGRLEKIKGQKYLTRAFKGVADKYKKAKLIILGDGPELRNLSCLIKTLSLEKNVFLLGNQKNVFPFLKNSDCFVFSSLCEGFGIALIEALALNLPIISTDCDFGPREILDPELDLKSNIGYPYFGKYGMLVKPITLKNDTQSKEVDMLSKMMTYTMENRDIIARKYSNGMERVKFFNKSKVLKDWEDIVNNFM